MSLRPDPPAVAVDAFTLHWGLWFSYIFSSLQPSRISSAEASSGQRNGNRNSTALSMVHQGTGNAGGSTRLSTGGRSLSATVQTEDILCN